MTTHPSWRRFVLGVAFVAAMGLASCAAPKSYSCGAGHEDIAKEVAADREHMKRIRSEIEAQRERQRIYSRIWDCMEAAESKGVTP